MQGFDPVGALNPYHPPLAMQTTITRKTQGGQVIGPAERISRLDALRMTTINAAYIGFEEKKKGSIEVGKLADLAVLTADFLDGSRGSNHEHQGVHDDCRWQSRL